jgi:hypothetical protein
MLPRLSSTALLRKCVEVKESMMSPIFWSIESSFKPSTDSRRESSPKKPSPHKEQRKLASRPRYQTMTAFDKLKSTSPIGLNIHRQLRLLLPTLLSSPNDPLLDCKTLQPTMEEPNPELETFRQQWRAEVSARAQADGNKASRSSKTSRKPPPITSLSSSTPLKPVKEDEDHVEPQGFSGLDGASNLEQNAEGSQTRDGKEPQSALEHYEKAVERETQGSLGDSLALYRKAFRVRAGIPLPYSADFGF